MPRCLHVLLLFVLPAAAQDDAAAPPAWYLEEIATLTAGSGRWVADNAAYKSEDEPFDAYVTEWQASFGGTTMSGRLFGIADGEETADFWEFRQYWHPGRREVVVEQFGWGGAVGIGTAWVENGETVSDQSFHAADGRQWRGGHRSRFPDADTHVTESFRIEDDRWIPNRSYTWQRSGELPSGDSAPGGSR